MGYLSSRRACPPPIRVDATQLALSVEEIVMKFRFSSLFSISLVLAFGCVTVWAQATAQISGNVTDPTGALIPGVEVTATKTDTGAVRTVVTNETGSYIPLY